jgi:hypothetical protein
LLSFGFQIGRWRSKLMQEEAPMASLGLLRDK